MITNYDASQLLLLGVITVDHLPPSLSFPSTILCIINTLHILLSLQLWTPSVVFLFISSMAALHFSSFVQYVHYCTISALVFSKPEQTL